MVHANPCMKYTSPDLQTKLIRLCGLAIGDPPVVATIEKIAIYTIGTSRGMMPHLRLENTEEFLGLVEADKTIDEALAITLINAQVKSIMALVPQVLVNCSSEQLTELSEQLLFWDKYLVTPSGQSLKACQ